MPRKRPALRVGRGGARLSRAILASRTSKNKLPLLTSSRRRIMPSQHDAATIPGWQSPRAQEDFAVLSVRPKVAELSFQLFGRALHPELFEVHKTRKVERGEFSARLDITTAGHVIT